MTPTRRPPLALAAALAALGLLIVLAAITAAAQAPDPAATSGDGEWTPLGGPVAPGGQVNALAVHPAISGTLYAAVAPPGTYDSGPSTIFKTEDGAATWSPVHESEPQIYSLAATGSNVYAGGFNPGDQGPGLLVSNDSGASWTTVLTFPNRGVWIDLDVDASNPDRAIAGGWVFIGSRDIGLVLGTSDGGGTWEGLLNVVLPEENASVNAVLIHPVTPTLILAAVREGDNDDTVLYRSEDGGATWPHTTAIPGAHVLSLAANTTHPEIIYAGTGGGSFTWGPGRVYRSTDAGLTWTDVLTANGGHVAFEPPGTVFAASPDQLWVSTSDGEPGTWIHTADFPGTTAFDIDLGPSPAALYAGTWEGGILKSTDGGASCNESNSGIETLWQLADLDIDPSDGQTVIAAAHGAGGFLSADGGQNWAPALDHEYVNTFAIDPVDPSIIYGGVSTCIQASVWRSDDGGANFTQNYVPPFFTGACTESEGINALDVAASNHNTVFAAGQADAGWGYNAGIVVRSLDGGASWTEVLTLTHDTQFWDVAVSPSNDDIVYASGEDCDSGPCTGIVYRSTDRGENWTLTLVSTQTVTSLAIDPFDPNIVYAADAWYWVHKTEDAGATWSVIRNPNSDHSGSYLALDANLPGRVYLAGHGYFAESTDAGLTWSPHHGPLNNGSPDMRPTAFAVSRDRPVQTLYAGLSGVWSYTRLAPAEGDRYVAKTGTDDVNACTDPGAPCLTVDHALGLANSGETVFVAAGTYVENLTVDKNVRLEGGYSGPPGWLRDLDAYTTTLQSGSPTVYGDWDGNWTGLPTVVHNGSEWEMWYTGADMNGAERIGHASGGPTSWAKSPESPLLEGSQSFVLLEDGLYRIWFDPAWAECIHYAESADGLAWSTPQPVLCPTHDGSWDSDWIGNASLVVDGGGTYWMYYDGINWGAEHQHQIGCATSSDGLAWTRCAENPILSPGEPGQWDSGLIADTAVVVDGSTFKMWYRGEPYPWAAAIGYATSPDGVTWTKYGANPVLEATPSTWDEPELGNHTVWFDGSTLHLWYSSPTYDGSRIGYATSSDGIAWSKHADPVLEAGWFGEWGQPVVLFEWGSDGAALDSFTVTGGDGMGGVLVRGTEATVANCLVTGNINRSDWGGGVHVREGATAHISQTAILSNTAGSAGGLGLMNDARAWLVDSTVEGNSTSWGAGGGIGLWWGATLTATDSLITGNSSSGQGGAMEVADQSTAILDGTDWIGNESNWNGGAIRVAHGGSRLEIRASSVLSNTTGGWGGGLAVEQGATAMVEGSDVAGNESFEEGGGIYAGHENTQLQVLDSSVISNTARDWGGGIQVRDGAHARIERVAVHGNQSTDGEGGGLVLWGWMTADLLDVTVKDNWAQVGAGGLNIGDGARVNLDQVQIRDNSAGWGAGLRLHGDTAVHGDRIVIQGNVARNDSHGGIRVENGAALTLTNGLITGNAGGAGRVWGGSQLHLSHATVADNWRDRGYGGLEIEGDSSATALNSILVYNDGSDLICWDGAPCVVEFSNLQHPWPGIGNISTNPKFVDRANGDYHLDTGSPCIDAAGPAHISDHDLDGDARPYDGDGDLTALPDMGADEYSGPPAPIEYLTDLYVDLTAPPGGDGTPHHPYQSVHEAVGSAFFGDTVHIADGTYLENVYIGLDLTLLGGYSGLGAPFWARDPALYPTILDGSEGQVIPGDWDGGQFGNPHVVWDANAGEYKMYYGASGITHPFAIGLATSVDGLTWEKHPDNPILMPDSETWEGEHIFEPFVRIEGPGDYKMWYDNGGVIGYATSSNGIEWTKYPDPVFEPDPLGWDSAMVRTPSVVWTGSEYRMAYEGHDGSWNLFPGIATSPDGIDWTRYGTEPVLGPGEPGAFDEWGIYRLDMAYDGSQYRMMYGGDGPGLLRQGLATSPDGFTWARHPDNPVFAGGAEPWENWSIWGAGLLWDDPTWKLYYAAIGDGGGAIGLATSGDGVDWTRDEAHNPVLEPGTYGQEGLPVVIVRDGATVALEDLTITRGYFWDGGGISIDNAHVTVTRCSVVENGAVSNGGGIRVSGGSTLEFYQSALETNTAGGEGGGLDASGGSTVIMDDASVSGNRALGGEAGGLHLSDEGTSANLHLVSITNNEAAEGGAGIDLRGEPGPTLTLHSVEIMGNVSRWGAGLRAYNSRVSGDLVWITANTATDDSNGGIVVENGGIMTLTNALITGNAGGAGSVWGSSRLHLSHATIADNEREDGTGGLQIAPDSSTTIFNSILAFNHGPGLECHEAAPCTVESSNLQHPWTGPGNISANPRFVDRAHGDYHLDTGSPSIDSADPAHASDHDLDGDSRPYDGDGDLTALPDMGADEYTGPPAPIEHLTDLYVDLTAPPGGDGTPDYPYQTVNEAVSSAYAGDTVHIADGTYVENVLLELELTLLGGYSGLGVPFWDRDPESYETVLDGSNGSLVAGDWDGASVLEPTVVHNGSGFEMWFTGWDMFGESRIGRAAGGPTSWAKSPEHPLLDGARAFVRLEGGSYRIWYQRGTFDGCIWTASSVDGLIWTEAAEASLCPLDWPSWDYMGIGDPSVVVDGDGTYWMYYEGADYDASRPVQIGCATSPDGLAWTRCAETPVLTPDPGSWDSDMVADPMVLLDGSTFRMWYSGRDGDGNWAIGYATSSDGLTWAKHGTNPVMWGTPESWDEGGVGNPEIWFDGTTLHMWYSSPIWYYPPTVDNSRIFYATSTDGLTWRKHPDPVLEPGWYGDWGQPVVNFQYDSTGSMLEGLTVTGGHGQGGVVIEGVTATISNCTITDNESLTYVGSAVAVSSAGASQIHHTHIISNTGIGVGIVGSSAASLQDSTVSHNRGAGITMNRSAILDASDSVISHNTGDHGGGIWMMGGSSARLERVDLLHNDGGTDGGGISVSGDSSLEYIGGLVEGNSAYYAGGGISSRAGTVTLEGVTIRSNQLESDGLGGTGNGAGLAFSDGTAVSLTDVLIEGNFSYSGAGLDVRSSAEVTLDGVTLVRNTAHSTATLRLSDGARVSGDRVWIQGNISSGDGVGGVEVTGSSALTLTNALIADNNGGAGSVNQGARLHISHTTVTANQRGERAGGLLVSEDSEAGVYNSILYYNGGTDLACAPGAVCTVESSDLQSGWPGNLSADPMFLDWPVGDYHLAATSPAIDTADPAHSIDHDADGELRPVDGDGSDSAEPDMGYDEYHGDPAHHDLAVAGAAPGGDLQAGLPVSVTADLYNAGDFAEDQVPVHCTIWEDGGLETYAETGYSGSIAPATYALVELPDWTPSASGPYTLTCESQLPGDADPGNDAFTRTGMVIAGGAPDVWAKDNETDTGEVPSDFPFWVSPDLWVRNQPDGGLVHQNPIQLVENTVYVRIRNRGDAPASGQVGVYWDRSRIGWPCIDGPSNVGTIPFTDLAPGEARILSIPWTPQEPGRHGLHIVIDAIGDPANWDARCSPHLPRWDNNIAWHNIIVFAHAPADIRAAAAEQTLVYLTNPYKLPKTVDLTVWRGTFPVEGTITILLGQTLMDRWLAHSSQGGQGIEINEETAVVTVTGHISATLTGLPMAAGEERLVTVTFDASTEGVYEVEFQEAIDGQSVGGLTYRWIEIDTVPPEVVATWPPPGAADVALDAPLVITFTEPIGPLSFELSLDPEPGAAGWLATWNPAGTVVTVTHPALTAGQTYTATISAGDAFANPVLAYPWSFTTAIGHWHIYLPVVLRNH